MANRVQLKRSAAATWTSANPVLFAGEIGVESDTRYLKIGDGVTAWTSLPYYNHPDLAAATAVSTGSTVVKRDSGGATNLTRLYISNAPTTANDATRKDYVDALGTNAATASTVMRRDGSANTSINQLDISAAAPTAVSHATRKDYVDALGTSSVSNDTIVRRSGAGAIAVNRVTVALAPVATDEATRKDYVDSQDAATRRVQKNNFVTAAYTTVLADEGKILYYDADSSAVTVTIPNNSTVAYPLGTWIEVMKAASGSVTISAAAGVNILPSAPILTNTWTSVRLLKTSTNTWVVQDGAGDKIPAFADPNADRLVFWDDSASAFAALTPTLPVRVTGTAIDVATASETAIGAVELATTAETTTGTDTTRAVTPAGVKAVADTKAALSHTHVATTDLTATGTKNSTTFLRGDNTWAVPAGGGGTVTVANITDATTVGRNVLMSADAAAVRTVIGAGTSSLVIGTTNTTAKAGDYQPTAANISDSTTIGRTILTSVDAAAVRTAISAIPAFADPNADRLVFWDDSAGQFAALVPNTGITVSGVNLDVSYGSSAGTAVQGNDARVVADQAAGTASIRTIGTGALQAAAGNHAHVATNITDSTTTGRAVLTAVDAASARTAIGAGTSNLAIGTTSTTAKIGDYQPSSANITDATSAATANMVIKRDASGRAKVAAPSATDDIARKDTVDAVGTRVTTLEAYNKVLVLGPSDAVPGGTPANTVIFRTV